MSSENWLTDGLELDRVVGFDGLPSWEHQASLPYIRSLIKELHRCGFAGLGMGRALVAKSPNQSELCLRGHRCTSYQRGR